MMTACVAHTSTRMSCERERAYPHACGAVVRCRVRSVRAFGVFVEVEGVDSSKDALIHRNDAARDGATFDRGSDESALGALEYFYPIGSMCYGKVRSVRWEEGRDGRGGGWRVALDASACDQETGVDLDPDGETRRERANDRVGSRVGGGDGVGGGGGSFAPELHAVLRGKVRTVKPVGVFVDIRGFRRGGLVHRTQISQYLDVPRDATDEEKVAIISGVVAEGDDVWVKVVEVEKQDGAAPRVSLSMKNVDQGNGEDLDPNNLNYEPPFRGDRGGFGGDRHRPLGADAGETTRTGEIRWGHHAGDVKQYGSGGKTYELVLDDDLPSEAAAPSGMKFGSGEFVTRMRAAGESLDDRDSRKKRKKEKKEKKEKKSKRHKSSKRSRRDYSSDSSYSSDTSRGRRR